MQRSTLGVAGIGIVGDGAVGNVFENEVAPLGGPNIVPLKVLGRSSCRVPEACSNVTSSDVAPFSSIVPPSQRYFGWAYSSLTRMPPISMPPAPVMAPFSTRSSTPPSRPHSSPLQNFAVIDDRAVDSPRAAEAPGRVDRQIGRSENGVVGKRQRALNVEASPL